MASDPQSPGWYGSYETFVRHHARLVEALEATVARLTQERDDLRQTLKDTAEELEANRVCNRFTWKDRACKAEAEVARLTAAPQQMADAAEMLWVVLANVSGGDWTQQSPEWQEVAARWRDNYFAAVKGHP